VSLLSQALDLDQAQALVDKSTREKRCSTALYLSVARGAALVGEWERTSAALLKAEEAVQTSELEAAPGNAQASASGGKRGWKGEEVSEERTESAKAFFEHRQEEHRREIAALQAVVTASKSQRQPVAQLARHFQRLLPFSFPPGETSATDNPFYCIPCGKLFAKETVFQQHLTGRKHIGACRSLACRNAQAIPQTLVNTLREGFGFEECMRRLSHERGASYKDTPRIEREVPQRLAGLQRRFENVLDAAGRLSFKEVFGGEGRPVKLEICSGTGEWALAQAEGDPGSDWVTLERRLDRVHQTFSWMAMKGLSNLCVLAGDASKVLPERLAAGSVQQIFVNHPEPPQQRGSDVEPSSQGAHLLTADFFASMHRVLGPGGLLTIVTDNLWYGRLLLRTVAGAGSRDRGALQGGCFSARPLTGANRREQETVGGFTLYAGTPGKDCGHCVQVSSYFDRLWAKEQVTERYFLFVAKAADPKSGDEDATSMLTTKGRMVAGMQSFFDIGNESKGQFKVHKAPKKQRKTEKQENEESRQAQGEGDKPPTKPKKSKKRKRKSPDGTPDHRSEGAQVTEDKAPAGTSALHAKKKKRKKAPKVKDDKKD